MIGENISAGITSGNIISGLIGSITTAVLTWLRAEIKRHKEYKALLNGIVIECDYNLSIIDEILNGVVNARGSFKRLSVDYFRVIREKSVVYRFDGALLSAISRLIVDMDLYNLEANYVFDGNMSSHVYAGVVDRSVVCITKKPVATDITETITSARDGVVGSLKALRKIAGELKRGKRDA